jgi:Domain of unknown function (DUF4113)
MDRFGTGSIGLGRAGMAEEPDWGMQRRALSPRYTTEWDELLVVKQPDGLTKGSGFQLEGLGFFQPRAETLVDRVALQGFFQDPHLGVIVLELA